MLVSAINTVEVDAAPGRVGEVFTKLPCIVRALLDNTECVGYAVTDNRAVRNAWIVSGYWELESKMRAHFDRPELDGFMDMLNSGLASRVKFNSFVVTHADQQPKH